MITDFQAEERFYSKKFQFSYSSLNKLMYVPNSFYKHYILLFNHRKLRFYIIKSWIVPTLSAEIISKFLKLKFVAMPCVNFTSELEEVK